MNNILPLSTKETSNEAKQKAAIRHPTKSKQGQKRLRPAAKYLRAKQRNQVWDGTSRTIYIKMKRDIIPKRQLSNNVHLNIHSP